MQTQELIEKYLGFLKKDYNFEYSWSNKRGTIYLFENKYGSIKYYEWQQFNEKEFSIIIENQIKTIDFKIEYPEKYAEYLKSRKSIFKDSKDFFWKMVSDIIKEEIEKKGNIFGLRLY